MWRQLVTNTRFATSAQTTKLLQRLLPADGGTYFRFAKVYQTFIFVISVSARIGFKCRRLQTAKTLPATSRLKNQTLTLDTKLHLDLTKLGRPVCENRTV